MKNRWTFRWRIVFNAERFSIFFFKLFGINSSDTASCLHNAPHEDDALGRSLPGTLLSLDAQCRRDRGTSACFKDERVCAQLFCFDAASGYCVAYRPAAEGSPCGDGSVNMRTNIYNIFIIEYFNVLWSNVNLRNLHFCSIVWMVDVLLPMKTSFLTIRYIRRATRPTCTINKVSSKLKFDCDFSVTSLLLCFFSRIVCLIFKQKKKSQAITRYNKQNLYKKNSITTTTTKLTYFSLITFIIIAMTPTLPSCKSNKNSNWRNYYYTYYPQYTQYRVVGWT